MTVAAIAARSMMTRREPWGSVRNALLVLLAACTILIAPAFAAPNYPELAGRITDQAGLLTPQDKADLESTLA
ncbi:MAG: hypothetical protein J0H04_04845, partial [Hyphomicrobium denitrificans]|nr:hypothetical protein [Hyphomicrobium denitrificans]